MTEPTNAFTPDWVSAPGDTIADLLEEKGWTQVEFASRAGYTTKHINLLVNGKVPITEDAALRLERVLGSTARFWLAREAQYREALARTEEQAELERQVEWLKKLPLAEMVRFGWVRKMPDKRQMVAECLKYFEVASVTAWESLYQRPVAAWRTSAKHQQHASAVAAWLRQGERKAALPCQPFDEKRFRETLAGLRRLTCEGDPAVFVPRLIEACARAGVAVVVAPAPKGCPVSGMTKWLTHGKALLMLSGRHKSDDHFWFTFFHEAGHLLLHGKRLLFIETEGELDGQDEEAANDFARDLLIPPPQAQELAGLPQTAAAIEKFAARVGVAPGIVVGRMQKDSLLTWGTQLNKLKVRYCWEPER